MIKNIGLYIVIVLSILLSGCIKENTSEGSNGIYDGERIAINAHIPNSSSVVDEDYIQTVRMVVFTQDGELVSNDLVQNMLVVGDGVSFSTQMARGINNVYIICNETTELKTQLIAIKKESDVEKIVFQPADVTTPIPMYGKVIKAFVTANRDGSNVQVAVDGVISSSLTINVSRLMAKINLTVIKNIADLKTDFIVEELLVKVCRIPTHTPLKPEQPYTSGKWTNSPSFTGVGILGNNGAYTKTNGSDGVTRYEIPSGVDKVTFPDIYIPEHLLDEPANAGEATYLLINAKCRFKNGSSQLINSTYIINIGQKPPENHNIQRNNHYDIYATVKGMGAMGIYAEIVVMDVYDLPINWKPVEGLVIVSDKESDFDYDAKVSKNVNVWNDYTVFSGILKVYHSETGYSDVLFKYGSLIAVDNDNSVSVEKSFVPPTDANNLNDILWYPFNYENPFTTIKSWNDIPHVENGSIPVENTQIAQGLGDPCKLVGLSIEQIDKDITDNNQWRMATPDDYAILLRASDNNENEYGYKTFHRHMLPHVKERNTSGVLAASAGDAGNYWTTKDVQTFGFAGMNPSGAALTTKDASQGLTIRCVRTSIPVSEMAVNSMPTISYQGDIVNGKAFNIVSNIPYWTATLIDDPSDPNYAQGTEFGDFSFAPGETNVRTVSGKYSQPIPVYIKRKEILNSRRFNIRVTGMGYDGEVESVIVTATQAAYILQGFMAFTPTISDTDRIPIEGAAYKVNVSITPTDVAVLSGTLQIRVGYNGVERSRSTTITTESNKYNYEGLELAVEKNMTPDVIGITFAIFLDNRNIGGVVYYQKNK